MTDLFLFAGEPSPADIVLRDPTTPGVEGPACTGVGDAQATIAAAGDGIGVETFVGTGSPSYAIVATGAGVGTEQFNGTGAPTVVLAASGLGVGLNIPDIVLLTGSGAAIATLVATGSSAGIELFNGAGTPSYSLIANGEGAGTMTPEAVVGVVGGRHRFYVTGEKEPKKAVSETTSPTEPLIVAVGLPETPADPVYVPAQPGSKALEKVLEPILAQTPAPQRRKGLKDEELIYMIMAGAA